MKCGRNGVSVGKLMLSLAAVSLLGYCLAGCSLTNQTEREGKIVQVKRWAFTLGNDGAVERESDKRTGGKW